jgi:CelD/BcsL family acetyltransferase involved in cellulose biosynthesis
MIETIEDVRSFEKLRGEWDELLQASTSNSFFLTWEWLYPLWKHFSGSRQLCIVTLRSGGRLVAIAPLASRFRRLARVVPFRSLEFIGTDKVCSDYLDLIIRRGHEPEAFQALGEYLGREAAVLEMVDVKRSGCLAARLTEGLSRHGWRLSEGTTDTCPFVNLSGHSWESYLLSLTANHRGDFGRKLRNLHKHFDVRFEQARSPAEAREGLARVVALHNMRWRERGDSDAFDRPELIAFHKDATEFALERGWLRLFVLSLDGQPVASLYGFRYHRTFYFLQSGFDPSYAKHSVGMITLGLTIKSAIDEGAEEYDLLRGAEPYKFRWTRETRDLGRLVVFPPRLPAFLYQRAQSVGRAAKTVVRRALPKTLTDRIAIARRTGVWKELNASVRAHATPQRLDTGQRGIE